MWFSRSSWCSSVGPDCERATWLATKRRLGVRIDRRRSPAACLSEVLAEVVQRAFERGRRGCATCGAALEDAGVAAGESTEAHGFYACDADLEMRYGTLLVDARLDDRSRAGRTMVRKLCRSESLG